MPYDASVPSAEDDPLPDALVHELRRAVARHGTSNRALSAAISDCVGDLKAKGLPRDDVPPAIRVLIQQGGQPGAAALAETPSVLEPLVERIIAECTATHYDGGEL
jgi:hypothetical protein